MVTEKVTVRLTEDTIAVLETLVVSGEYDSVSDVVMSAINDFLKSKFTPEQIGKILEERSRSPAVKPESIMDSDDRSDFDKAIREAVSRYIQGRSDEPR